jgi:hypothetical protein
VWWFGISKGTTTPIAFDVGTVALVVAVAAAADVAAVAEDEI